MAEELRRYVLGWKAYFGLADTPGVFRDLDQWIHRRLRTLQLRQWKRGKDSVPGVEGSRCEREPRLASCSVRAKLVARGRAPRPAHGLARGVLRRAGCAPAHAVLTSTHRTARCGTACLVVWEGKDRDRRSSPIPIARHALCLERESLTDGGSTGDRMDSPGPWGTGDVCDRAG